MFDLKNISIRNKLILMQVFTSLLVLGTFFVVFIFTDITNYKQRKADNMISLAQVIALNSIPTLQFSDEEAAKALLEELHNSSPDILHAVILNTDGTVFTQYSRTSADTMAIPAALAGKRYLYEDDRLFVSNDITVDNNKVIGKVLLETELTELAAMKTSRFEIAGILLLAALLFSFIIAMFIQSYISNRLLYLVNKMKEAGKTGRYDKVIIDEGKDEIGLLVKGFNDLMQQVKESQQKKDEFIGIASHELRTPLTTIKGYIELLNMMETADTNKRFVRKALDNVNKLERLIRDLLDVSKIQSGQLELNLKEFPIGKLLDDTIAAVQMINPGHAIVLKNAAAGEIVFADRQRIEQVLINLLSNAIKYSPGETTVIVEAYRSASGLVVKVKDYGIGIPREEQLNVFERFYRTRGSSSHIAGFGLGLYISRDIILRHHGKIWIETEEKGCSFYFSLPLQDRKQINSSPPGEMKINSGDASIDAYEKDPHS